MHSFIWQIWRIAAVMILLGASSVPVAAQDWPEFLQTKQLFRVIVKGKDADGITLQPVKGTAWAVAPGVLITADHVTGKAQIYQNASSSDKLFIPRRTVTIRFSAEKWDDGSVPKEYLNGIVTTSPFESIDAARIGFAELKANPFRLSACDIRKDAVYKVLKFNDGNVFQPIPVEIRLRAYGRSKLGDAGSVAVMGGLKGAIVEGDSGSPVIDPDGRVIGLVSAINADSGNAVQDEVHVTLVKSFLDLIPLQIGEAELLDIPCSERVRLKRVDQLEAELAEAQGSLKTLKTQKQALSDRLQELETRHVLMMRQVNTLLWNQVRLAEEAERAAIRSQPAEQDGDMAPEDQNAFLWEMNKAAFATEPNREPLRPTVKKISSELGSPNWKLTGAITSSGVNIDLAYHRTLSGPPYAVDMRFCLTPIIWDVPDGTASERDPSHRKFYEPLEGPFQKSADAFSHCPNVSHSANNDGGQDPNSVTKGRYQWSAPTFTIGMMKSLVTQQYPGRSWSGMYYLQIFEPVMADGETIAVTTDDVAGYRLHTRAFVDLIRDDVETQEASALPCKIYVDVRSLIEAVADGEENLPEENECTKNT